MNRKQGKCSDEALVYFRKLKSISYERIFCVRLHNALHSAQFGIAMAVVIAKIFTFSSMESEQHGTWAARKRTCNWISRKADASLHKSGRNRQGNKHNRISRTSYVYARLIRLQLKQHILHSCKWNEQRLPRAVRRKWLYIISRRLSPRRQHARVLIVLLQGLQRLRTHQSFPYLL